MIIQCHEAEHTSNFFNSAKLTSPVPHHPSFAIVRDVDLSAVITRCDIPHSNWALQLFEQPSYILHGPFALMKVACYTCKCANVNKDASRSLFNLCLSRAFLSYEIADLIIPDPHVVSGEALPVRSLLSQISRENARFLPLDLMHGLQLSRSSPTLRPKNNKLLVFVTARRALQSIFVHEKHECAILILY